MHNFMHEASLSARKIPLIYNTYNDMPTTAISLVSLQILKKMILLIFSHHFILYLGKMSLLIPVIIFKTKMVLL